MWRDYCAACSTQECDRGAVVHLAAAWPLWVNHNFVNHGARITCSAIPRSLRPVEHHAVCCVLWRPRAVDTSPQKNYHGTKSKRQKKVGLVVPLVGRHRGGHCRSGAGRTPAVTNDMLNTWLERFGGNCPACGERLDMAPDSRCPSCQRRLCLGIGIVQHNVGAWIAGVIALAVSLTASLFPLLAGLSVMVMDLSINELGFFAGTLAVFLVFLVAILVWIKLRSLIQRVPVWIAWTFATMCSLPALGALGLLLYVAMK